METSATALNLTQPITIRAVIVEDDPSVRSILVNWIQEAEGFSCVGEFSDAESAVSKMAERNPHIALVDIHLPGLNGIDCVRKLKPRLSDTQFVMLTMYENANYIFDALSAGATGYLLKRTPRETLINGLREVHAGGSPMSSNIARLVVQSFQRKKKKSKLTDDLSKRESEVLSLLAKAYMYKDISDKIGISLPTVNTYIRRIYEKLHVHSRAEAVAVYAGLPMRKS